MGIPEAIKNAREKKKMTSAELATIAKVSQQLVSDWESGRREPSASILLLLSKILNIDLKKIRSKPKYRRKIVINKGEQPCVS